ncbi:MAG: alpha/beta hydrolase [Solirubrobacteraceae bacterium]
MGLDPDNATFLEAARAKPQPPLAETSISDMRSAVEALIPLGFEREDVEEVQDHVVDGTPVRVYRAGPDGAPAVVWLHGGSFTRCGLHTHDTLLRRFANQAGCTVVAVDYRLAPEAQYPTQLVEALAVLEWWRERERGALYLAGESSGGTLTASLALRLRDQRREILAGLLLLLPVLDRDSGTTSRRELSEEYLLTDEQLHWMFDRWAPGAADDDHYVYPYRASSLGGLPHTIVVTAEFDPLRDEGDAFATRIRDAGGSAEQHRVSSITHHAPLVPKAIPAGAAVVDRAAAALRLHAHATPAQSRS